MKREKHSDEERLKVVERYLDCGNAKLTAKEFGVDRHCVMEWAEGFRLYGIEGVMRRPPRTWWHRCLQKLCPLLFHRAKKADDSAETVVSLLKYPYKPCNKIGAKITLFLQLSAHCELKKIKIKQIISRFLSTLPSNMLIDN